MTATLVPAELLPEVRPLPESRPPYAVWRAAPLWAAVPDQPPLDVFCPLADPEQPVSPTARSTTTTAAWCTAPSSRLPDAARWSASLALAVVEALHARRPVAQLNRWLDEEVLAAVSLHQRRRLAARKPAPPPAVLHSVRVQHPQPEVAEVAAHLVVGRRSVALALRLEALGPRWLCTALELGPQPGR